MQKLLSKRNIFNTERRVWNGNVMKKTAGALYFLNIPVRVKERGSGKV